MSEIQRFRNNKKLIEAVSFLKLEFPVKDISTRMGVDKGNLSSFLSNKKSVSKKFLESFEKEYRVELSGFNYDKEFYQDIEESKLKEPQEEYLADKNKELPLIPINAMAGFSNGDSQVLQYDITNSYRIPELDGKGVKYLIRVSGSSMYPKYSNGDLLACKPLKDKTFFQWGKAYVLDTEQGAIVKRLFPCKDDDNCLECRSDNKTHYPPFHIPKDSIRSIAIVVGVIRLE